MPAATKDQAIDLLRTQIEEQFGPDELLEIDNELFEEDPYTEEEANDDPIQLVERLADYLNGEREPEEIVQVWNLIFPRHRNVWYDEESKVFHYNEPSLLPAD